MYEYKVIPAPMRINRAKGASTAGERLAIEVQDAINSAASDGWEYIRSDTMTVMDKPGRFSRPVEVIETVLVFRRKGTQNQRALLQLHQLNNRLHHAHSKHKKKIDLLALGLWVAQHAINRTTFHFKITGATLRPFYLGALTVKPNA